MSVSKITKIGVLVVVSIAMLVWGVSYLKGINLFKTENVYYVVYKDVNGIDAGNEVLISGYKVGQVMGVEYIPDTISKFVVSFTTGEKFRIRKGSVAEVFSKGYNGHKGDSYFTKLK
ncbi:MAG: MCE family protein [Chloroflexia bacterium]|nr:MCE family protein [Chloroflexia bacterium]